MSRYNSGSEFVVTARPRSRCSGSSTKRNRAVPINAAMKIGSGTICTVSVRSCGSKFVTYCLFLGAAAVLAIRPAAGRRSPR